LEEAKGHKEAELSRKRVEEEGGSGSRSASSKRRIGKSSKGIFG
jgi:hypothetical protein